MCIAHSTVAPRSRRPVFPARGLRGRDDQDHRDVTRADDPTAGAHERGPPPGGSGAGDGLRVAVLSCGHLDASVARRLAELPETSSVMLLTAPYGTPTADRSSGCSGRPAMTDWSTR